MSSEQFPYLRLTENEEVFNNSGQSSRSQVHVKKQFQCRRRLRLRVPGLARLFRKKSPFDTFIASCGKVVKRLIEGRSHFSELFAGNYMFMQVSPTPLGSLEKAFGDQQAGSSYLAKKVS